MYGKMRIFDSEIKKEDTIVFDSVSRMSRNAEEGFNEYKMLYKSGVNKEIIKKHSRDFGGSLDDPDVIKLCGCSRNSYYKYKREIKTQA